MTEKLEIGGLEAEEIAEKYGTPLFVYDAEKIREQYRRLDEAFSSRYEDFRISFAVKSNLNPSIAQLLVNEGASLDCAAKSEILLANEVDAEEIMYTAPYNRRDEIEYAIEHGATVNLDSVFLLDKIDEMPEEICFRIDPGIGRGDFGLVLGGGDTKFGIPEERAVEAYRKAKERGAEKFGIHMMTGSNVRDPEYFGQITEKLLEIAGEVAEELDIQFEFVDIGGGLGIPYRSEQEELDVEKTAENVTEKFSQGIENHDIGRPELRIEPGRFLVAQSGHLLSRVTGVKENGGTEFIGIDTGMHHNIRPMLLDAYHEILIANELERPVDGAKTVVGPVCSSTDVMAEERELPDMEESDLVSIEDIGAYGFTMASHWNSRPLPAEVLVEDGEAEVLREREGLRDVFHGTELEKERSD
ncbi:MAG: diaminopimelate decarboxylase [Candidatus Nanosalina sp.]